MKFLSDTHMQRLTYERLFDTPSTMAAACGPSALAGTVWHKINRSLCHHSGLMLRPDMRR